MDLRPEWTKTIRRLTSEYASDTYFDEIIFPSYNEHPKFESFAHIDFMIRRTKHLLKGEYDLHAIVAIWFHAIDIGFGDDVPTNNAYLAYEYLSNIGCHHDFMCDVDHIIHALSTKHAIPDTRTFELQQKMIDLKLSVYYSDVYKIVHFIPMTEYYFSIMTRDEFIEKRLEELRKLRSRAFIYDKDLHTAKIPAVINNVERELKTYGLTFKDL